MPVQVIMSSASSCPPLSLFLVGVLAVLGLLTASVGVMHTSMSLQRGSSASSSSSFDTSTFEESKEEVLLRSQSPTRLAKGALDNYKKGFSFKGKGIGNTVNKPQEDITGCQCKGDKFGMNCAQEVSKAVTYLPYELEQAQLDVKGKIPERLFARDALKQCKTDIDESLASAVDDKVANVNISDAINQPDRGLEAALAAAANLHAHGGKRKLASKRAAYAVRISKLYDTVRDPVQCLHGHTFKSYLLYRIPAALDLPGTIAAAKSPLLTRSSQSSNFAWRTIRWPR